MTVPSRTVRSATLSRSARGRPGSRRSGAAAPLALGEDVDAVRRGAGAGVAADHGDGLRAAVAVEVSGGLVRRRVLSARPALEREVDAGRVGGAAAAAVPCCAVVRSAAGPRWPRRRAAAGRRPATTAAMAVAVASQWIGRGVRCARGPGAGGLHADVSCSSGVSPVEGCDRWGWPASCHTSQRGGTAGSDGSRFLTCPVPDPARGQRKGAAAEFPGRSGNSAAAPVRCAGSAAPAEPLGCRGRRSPRRRRPWRGGGGAAAARRRPRGGGR